MLAVIVAASNSSCFKPQKPKCTGLHAGDVPDRWPATTPGPVAAYAPVVTTAYYAPPAVYYRGPRALLRGLRGGGHRACSSCRRPGRRGPGLLTVRPSSFVPKFYIRGEPVRNVLRAVTP